MKLMQSEVCGGLQTVFFGLHIAFVTTPRKFEVETIPDAPVQTILQRMLPHRVGRSGPDV
jgi:hypothetical protein